MIMVRPAQPSIVQRIIDGKKEKKSTVLKLKKIETYLNIELWAISESLRNCQKKKKRQHTMEAHQQH